MKPSLYAGLVVAVRSIRDQATTTTNASRAKHLELAQAQSTELPNLTVGELRSRSKALTSLA